MRDQSQSNQSGERPKYLERGPAPEFEMTRMRCSARTVKGRVAAAR